MIARDLFETPLPLRTRMHISEAPFTPNDSNSFTIKLVWSTRIRLRDQGDTPEIMDEILTTASDLELEVNEDDIEELIMGHEDELTIEELQEILNEEHQETQRNVSVSF
ncbi:hypothetical protein TNCV_1109071 [Trichonephila clavipes]|nr:hypothetical protein TNCV_1109071 [Trichonephila clavipes]